MISKKEVYVVAAILLIVATLSWAFPRVPNAGAPSGTLSAEDYDGGYLRQAGGFFSSLPISLSGASGDITSGDDITAGDDLTVTDDATISGGLLNLTTSNTATSTAIMGCIQTYATSTATAWKIGIGSVATSSPFYSAGTGTNFVLAAYGTCPF